MAAIRCKQEVLVLLSGKKLYIYGEGKEGDFELPDAVKEVREEKTDEEDKPRKNVTTTPGNPNCILAATFSESGKYFAVGDNNKQLHLYDVKSDWRLLYSRSLPRRCTALTFSHSEADLLVADRTGDVYRYPVALEAEGEGNVLLGHLSMVLDVALTKDDKYVITSDRDEKIRISHYPNAYSIHAFCLLHTEYVNQVLVIEDHDCLVSGSGDGRVAVWSLDGCCQHVIQEEDQSEQNGDQQSKVESENTDNQSEVKDQDQQSAVKRLIYDESLSILAVIYQKSCKLHMYLLQSDCGKVKVTHRQEVDLPGECWDICFGPQHRLWSLQDSQNTPVSVYTCQRDGNQFKVTQSHEDETVISMVQNINTKWDDLKNAIDWRTEFISLTKIKSFDNVQQYLHRKEERIKGTKSIPEEPPEKKVKNSG